MHLYGEVLKNQFSLKFTHVPYRGSAPAIVDLLSGQVHILVDQIPSILPHIQSGKLRAIAVANPTRIATLPNVPTFAEAGIDGADAISWFGLVAPRGTPKAVAERLSAAVQTALKDPAVIAKLQALGATAEGTSSEDMTRHIERQLRCLEAAGCGFRRRDRLPPKQEGMLYPPPLTSKPMWRRRAGVRHGCR